MKISIFQLLASSKGSFCKKEGPCSIITFYVATKALPEPLLHAAVVFNANCLWKEGKRIKSIQFIGKV